MALTKIPAHLSSTPSISDSGSSTAITIDSSGNVSLAGNLSVTGSTTTADNLVSADKNITLNYHASNDTSGSADGAGITIQDAVDASNNATLLWDASNDRFSFSHPVNISHGTPALRLHDSSSSATTTITLDGVNTTIDSNGTDGDIIFKGQDSSSEITALTLDMSDAGTATFNHDIKLGSSGRIGIGIAPVEMLDIQSASGDARIRLDAPASSDTEIKFFNAGSAQYTIGHDDGTDNFVIGGANVDAPLVSITKAGKVGIGVTSVPENLSVRAANSIIAAESTADSQRIGFQAKYIDHGTLYGSFEYTTGDAQLWIDNNFTGNGGNYSDINIRNKDTSGNFQTAMKIKGGNAGNNGYIGIGVDSPNTKLHVVNNVNAYTSGILLSNADSITEASGIWHDNSGNTSLNIETRYNSASAEIKLNLRTSSTAVNALTLAGDGSSRRQVSTDGSSVKRYSAKSNVIQTTGLVGYWDPGDSNCYSGSGTTVNDLSPNTSNNLTMSSGCTWSSNSNRSTFNFDGGSNAYMSGNLNLAAYKSCSFSFWLYVKDVNSLSSSYQLNGIQISNHYMYLGLYSGSNDSARMYGYIGLGTNIPSTTSGTENAYVNSDEWVYMTIQAGHGSSTQTGRTKGRAEVYLNGALVTRSAEIDLPNTSAGSANSFYLGRVQGGYYLDGNMGPAMVYERMLHQWEINENMKVHAPMYMF